MSLPYDRIGLLLHIEEHARAHPNLSAIHTAVMQELLLDHVPAAQKHNAEVEKDRQARKVAEDAAVQAEIEKKQPPEMKPVSAAGVALGAVIYPPDSIPVSPPNGDLPRRTL